MKTTNLYLLSTLALSLSMYAAELPSQTQSHEVPTRAQRVMQSISLPTVAQAGEFFTSGCTIRSFVFLIDAPVKPVRLLSSYCLNKYYYDAFNGFVSRPVNLVRIHATWFRSWKADLIILLVTLISGAVAVVVINHFKLLKKEEEKRAKEKDIKGRYTKAYEERYEDGVRGQANYAWDWVWGRSLSDIVEAEVTKNEEASPKKEQPKKRGSVIKNVFVAWVATYSILMFFSLSKSAYNGLSNWANKPRTNHPNSVKPITPEEMRWWWEENMKLQKQSIGLLEKLVHASGDRGYGFDDHMRGTGLLFNAEHTHMPATYQNGITSSNGYHQHNDDFVSLLDGGDGDENKKKATPSLIQSTTVQTDILESKEDN